MGAQSPNLSMKPSDSAVGAQRCCEILAPLLGFSLQLGSLSRKTKTPAVLPTYFCVFPSCSRFLSGHIMISTISVLLFIHPVIINVTLSLNMNTVAQGNGRETMKGNGSEKKQSSLLASALIRLTQLTSTGHFVCSLHASHC